MKLRILFLALMLISAPAFADGGHPHEPYTGSAPFEKMKALAGKWEGTFIENDGKASPANVSYEVSSGGTALIEKLGPGTPGEMVSIYNDEKGKLVMTHYCLMRNQPKLKLVSSDENNIHLEMTEEANGVKPSDDHMHDLKITFNGKDEITQFWTGIKDGKPAETPVTVKLKRVS